MTVITDGLDLAPTVPSRVVYGTVLIPTEDRGPKGAWIEATIPGEIKLPGEHTTITGRSARFPVNPDGSFELRLPTIAEGIEPEDWALKMRLSWRKFEFPMRVPVGEDPIWIEDCLFPELVPGGDPAKYFFSGAQVRSVTMVGTDQPARARAEVIGGVLSLDYDFPQGAQGLPGVNAIENDEAVAGYIETAGHSETKAALERSFASRDTAPTASRTAVDYWVSPTGDDAASGSSAAPFRTLAQVVAMIPDMVRSDHAYTIHLAEGDWGSETLYVAHRLIYGNLTITGSTGDREKHRVHRVHLVSVFGDVRIENITATRAGTLSGPAFWFERAMPWIDVANCKAVPVDPSIREQSGVIGLLADYGSTVRAMDSEFNGRRYGLRSNYGSRIFSRDNTGTGNVFGLGARWGGILSTYGTQPGGDTALTTDSGGIIGHGFGGKVGVPKEMCLVEAHESSEGRAVRKQWLVRRDSAGLSDTPINEGQRLRLTFQKTNVHGPYMIDVQYAGTVQNSSGAHHIRSVFGPVITDTEVRDGEADVLASKFGSGMIPEDMIQLTHSGGGDVFYIDIVPHSAQGSWFGVDVEISNMRNYDAPTMLSAQII